MPLIGYARTAEDAVSIRRYTEDSGPVLARVFRESSRTDWRAWRQVFSLLASRASRGLVVARLPRLAPSLTELLRLLELVDDQALEFIAVEDNVDSRTARGRQLLRMLADLGRWRRDHHSDVTKATLREKRKSGAYVGGAPYGWCKALGPDGKLTALQPVATEQHVLGRIRVLRASGVTQEGVAEQLNRDGVLTRSGGRWSRRGVQCACASSAARRE
jgi:DNA invertase Pin-like site-specific DNA recombinase